MKGFYPAKVINNIDTRQQGRVQIKIEHLHYGFTTPMLPWARQGSLSTGGDATHGVSSIPEIDSYVWVWFEDVDVFMKTPYYMGDVQFAGKHPHGLFTTDIAPNLGTGSASVYPNTKYTYYANGICIGVDSSSGNPEIFLYHPSAYIYINNLGIIEFKAGAVATQFTLLGETLKTWLENHTHPTGTGPSGPPVQAATLTTCLSTTIKHN